MGINKHDASGQLTGYLYQVFTALLLLIQAKNPEVQICIEKFDDIAFLSDDEPIVLIQTKHHTTSQGNLSDTSTDLWRTIKSWCDYIVENDVDKTQFFIITTSDAPEYSATYFLANSCRDEDKAWNILQDTAKQKVIEESVNKKFYESFLNMDIEIQKKLIANIYVLSNAPIIKDLKDEMMPYIRMTTFPQFVDKVYDEIVGWWTSEVIKGLLSKEPYLISQKQLHLKIADIGSKYKQDSLPIDVDLLHSPSDEEMGEVVGQNTIFGEQLKLIDLSAERIRRCIRDYYNAYSQRSIWVREQLTDLDELQRYNDRLIDEWDRLYLIMKEELEDYGEELTEDIKKKRGRKLLTDIESLNIFIRQNVSDPFIMRGSYHDLSNQLKVGWHIDFLERLNKLLEEEV